MRTLAIAGLAVVVVFELQLLGAFLAWTLDVDVDRATRLTYAFAVGVLVAMVSDRS